MRILVFTINYTPEATGFAPHVAGACEYLASRGHAVTVITGFPFAPRWKRFEAYRGRFIAKARINGVTVWRVTHFIPRRAASVLQRLLMEASFCLTSLFLVPVWVRARFDLIWYVGAQPSIAMLARFTAAILRVPYVVNIQDLATDAARDVGIVRRRFLLRWLRRFEFAAYRKAAAAMVLSRSFRDALVEEGYSADRVHIIRSPIDTEAIRPVPRDPSFRSEAGVADDDFVVLFAGSMGLKQGLSNVIEAARLLRAEHADVKWILVGDGEQAAALRARIAELVLTNHVRMMPLQDSAMMAAMFAAADLLLLNQVGAVKDTVVPSKLLTYMAAGKAILASVNAQSQGAAILNEAGGGIIIPPDDPHALARAVVAAKQSDSLAAMGARDRAYAEEHFDQRKVFAELEDVLDNAITARPPLHTVAASGTST